MNLELTHLDKLTPSEIQEPFSVFIHKLGDYGYTLLHLAVYGGLEFRTQILIHVLQTLEPTEPKILHSYLNIIFIHLFPLCVCL